MNLLAHPGLSNTDLQVNTVGHGGRRPFLRPGAGRAITDLWLVSERETGIPMEV